jgi:hypothetical protein
MSSNTGYTMTSTASYKVGAGSHPTVSINNQSTIVAGWASTASTNLYCKVGVFDTGSQEWSWGEQSHYDGGDSASLAINNENTVVDVHRSSTGSNNLFCRVGVADTTNKTIVWGGSVEFDAGGTPFVALNDNNNVIVVWQSTASTKLYCRAGIVDPHLRTITWGPGQQFNAGSHPTVDINNNNTVIIGFASTSSTKLLYQVGYLYSDTGLVSTAPSVEYDGGDHNDLTIDDANFVWETHKSSESNTAYYRAGTLTTNTPVWTINWDQTEYPKQNTEVVRISMPPLSQSADKLGVSLILNNNDISVQIWECTPTAVTSAEMAGA